MLPAQQARRVARLQDADHTGRVGSLLPQRLMEPLLLYPDPPPELAQALDLGGYPWKSVSDELSAQRAEPDDGWAGAIVCADVDPEGAFSLCRALRKRDLPLEP